MEAHTAVLVSWPPWIILPRNLKGWKPSDICITVNLHLRKPFKDFKRNLKGERYLLNWKTLTMYSFTENCVKFDTNVGYFLHYHYTQDSMLIKPLSRDWSKFSIFAMIWCSGSDFFQRSKVWTSQPEIFSEPGCVNSCSEAFYKVASWNFWQCRDLRMHFCAFLGKSWFSISLEVLAMSWPYQADFGKTLLFCFRQFEGLVLSAAFWTKLETSTGFNQFNFKSTDRTLIAIMPRHLQQMLIMIMIFKRIC